MNISAKVDDLFESQLRDWELARVNYGLLGCVKSTSLNFGDFSILVQFNPERIKSSAAKVDTKSIEERPCFLCSKNRPSSQQGLTIENNLTILVNPYPIFNRHLTIVSENHIDQRISGNFSSMLSLASKLTNYVIFYNGPQCGASAPDHFHFQAGNRGFLPIEDDFNGRRFVKLLTEQDGVGIYTWAGYNRGIVTLSGKDDVSFSRVFDKLYAQLNIIQDDKPEPMLNILAYAQGGGLIVHIIPRVLHRPSQFFDTGAGQILLSPASVDLGGVVITPREEDFLKITKENIIDIFSQVCMKERDLAKLLKNIL